MAYEVFTRTWWTDNPAWPGGLEPQPGRKHHLAVVETRAEAQEMCREYNATHDPGRYSHKAEFEEA